MKIIEIEANVQDFTIEGTKYDRDQYNLVGKTPMSTQEYTVHVDHISKTVYGDCIRYGDWGDLDPEEVKEIIAAVEEADKLLRPYTGYTFK